MFSSSKLDILPGFQVLDLFSRKSSASALNTPAHSKPQKVRPSLDNHLCPGKKNILEIIFSPNIATYTVKNSHRSSQAGKMYEEIIL